MNRGVLAAALVGLLSLVAASSAIADGTETLGPPSVAINANATRVVAAGVGMTGFTNTPNSFNVTVPAGATVRQVLLYWGGHFTSGVGAPDNAISVNGNPVVGTQIGGPAFFFTFMGDEFFTTYRTDITSLGLVTPGANTLTISNMEFTSVQGVKANDGAGVLVLYSNAADPPGSSLGVRDGLDLAFSGFPPPRQSTVPQTFTFAPALVARTANLASMAGSVSGFEPEFGFRPNQLRITFDLGGTGDVTINNPYQSNQGREWDASNIDVNVPAGASQMTVQALSGGPNPSGGTAVDASFAWNAAAVSIPGVSPPPPPPPPPGGEGCTPGYWKNHLGSWPPTGFSPNQALSTVFSAGGLGTLASKTLVQALDFGGGSSLTEKKQILLRAAVASLLNAAHPDVDFGMTTADVIAAVNAALASNNKDTIVDLATKLDKANNAGCPLN
jgi:hypothetical protein